MYHIPMNNINVGLSIINYQIHLNTIIFKGKIIASRWINPPCLYIGKTWVS